MPLPQWTLLYSVGRELDAGGSKQSFWKGEVPRVRVVLPQASIQYLCRGLVVPLTTGSRIISHKKKKLNEKSQVTNLSQEKGYMWHEVSDLRCFWASSTLVPQKPKALLSYFPRKVTYWMLGAGEVRRTQRESQPRNSRWVSKVSILFCCPSPLSSLLCHLPEWQMPQDKRRTSSPTYTLTLFLFTRKNSSLPC